MGLRTKFSVTAALLIAILGLLLTQWFVEHEQALYTDNLVSRGAALARTFALNATVPLAFGDDAELTRFAEGIMREPEVRYVLVLDHQGRILASSGVVPSELVPSLLLKASRPELGAEVFSTAQQLHMIRSVRVPPTPAREAMTLGAVIVGMSTAANEARIREAANWAIFVMCVLVASAIFIFNFFARIILRPIQQLTQATERVAAGDLSSRVPVERADELGHVAYSFNEMARALKAYRDDLTRTNEELARANEELKRGGARLEEEVARRTQELRDANDALRRLMAEKEDFLRAVSHDLNAPLRNIAGMANLILRREGTGIDPTVRDRVQRIQTNVEREMEMIQALLDLSKIRTERRPVVEVPLGRVIEGIRSQLGYQIEERRVRFVVETPLPVLWGDPTRIRQVFQNLIENAIKYAAEVDPTVHVGGECRDGLWRFWVADNGIGIAEADRERIFWMFRRGRDARMAQIPGRGVGLAHVRSIVETYGGRIRVESEPGKGSRFLIEIPAASFAPPPPGTEPQSIEDTGLRQAALAMTAANSVAPAMAPHSGPPISPGTSPAPAVVGALSGAQPSSGDATTPGGVSG